MTANSLYATLGFVVELDGQLGLQKTLDEIRDALTNIANQPAQPTHQTALAAALSNFAKSAALMARRSPPPRQIQKIRKARAEFIDLGLSEKAVEELDERITTVIDEVIEESTTVVLVKYTGDPGRKNDGQVRGSRDPGAIERPDFT